MVSSLMTPTMITATFSTPALTTKWMERTSVGNCWCCECCPALPSLYVITWNSEHQAKLITNIYPSIKNVKWKQGSVTRVAWWGGDWVEFWCCLVHLYWTLWFSSFSPCPASQLVGTGDKTLRRLFSIIGHIIFLSSSWTEADGKT